LLEFAEFRGDHPENLAIFTSMKPRSNLPSGQLDLFKAQFSQILDLDHPLVVLADKINWPRFDLALAECFSSDVGAPALATRLMIGLLYLKHAFNESDESLLARWLENPYWQYFCGFSTMQHELPLHSTSLVKWRQRVGAERLAELLKETLDLAVKAKEIAPKELQQVNVDTTVQEKNITHPTDSKLLLKAIEKLAQAAKNRGLRLRQTYVRVAKRTSIMVGRYAHAKQFKRMRKELRRLKTWLGRILRDIRRQKPEPDPALEKLLTLCERVHNQQPKDSGKLYSLHEPEVVCISKGKAHKRYEFGQKIALATSNRGNWIVGVQLCSGNPYDGHTLSSTLENVTKNTGLEVTAAYVDKGYRGHGYQGSATIHIAGSGERGLTRTEKRRRRRRSAIEPKIGHLKSDNRMNRCFLRGLTGDAINAVLAAAGSNLRKLLQSLFFELIFSLWNIAIGRVEPKKVRSVVRRAA
jgi:IS5 family transposase